MFHNTAKNDFYIYLHIRHLIQQKFFHGLWTSSICNMSNNKVYYLIIFSSIQVYVRRLH